MQILSKKMKKFESNVGNNFFNFKRNFEEILDKLKIKSVQKRIKIGGNLKQKSSKILSKTSRKFWDVLKTLLKHKKKLS